MTHIDPTSDPGGGAPTRVLYVEGDPFVSQVPSRFLVSCGYVVTVAHSGKEAWRLCAGSGRFDIVIADGDTPAVGGFRLVSKLRSGGDPVPIVVFLANIDNELAGRYAQLGGIEILKKPPALSDLSECLKAIGGETPCRLPPNL